MQENQPRRFEYETQKDGDYGGIKFHHVFHSYLEYHNHDFYEFILCDQGSYDHRINSKTYPTGKLDACFLFPDDAHILVETSPDSSHYCISVQKGLFDRVVLAIDPHFFQRFPAGEYRPFSISEARLKKIVLSLERIQEKQSDPFEQGPLVSFLLLNLLEPLFAQREAISEPPRPDWLSDLIAEIHQPENLKWDVSDAVARTHYSKTHLSRLFKSCMGTSIGDYLQKVKLANARDILVHSDMPIGELCELIGHSSPSHFSSAFKKAYGMAPGKYREKYRRKE